MELERLVCDAGRGDVAAFVALTRRFQHFAFGSALALVHDFQQAEDVVQEAFLAAWGSLAKLDDPRAFPGWLRGIVRHEAFRLLRRKHLAAVPLTAAEGVPSDEPGPDRTAEQRQETATALRQSPSCRRHSARSRRCSTCTNARSRTSRLFWGSASPP
jgi:DNA-directed RNA polymerase specialized sigma24 family protein